jgi:hypothetical protein
MWLARFRSLYPAIRQPLSLSGSEDAAVAPGEISGHTLFGSTGG